MPRRADRPRREPAPSALAAWIVRASGVGTLGLLLPRPPGQAEQRESDRATLHEPPLRGRLRSAAAEQLPIGVERFARRRLERLRGPLGPPVANHRRASRCGFAGRSWY